MIAVPASDLLLHVFL